MLKSLLVFLFIILLAFSGCSVKDVKEPEIVKKVEPVKKPELKREPISKELLEVIDKVVYLISTNQRTRLNNEYIHKKHGYFDVYLQKKVPNIKRKMQIDGKEENYFSIAKSIIRAKDYTQNLKLENFSPIFYCSPNDDTYYGWNKEGLFLSENILFPLSQRLVDKKNIEEVKFAKLVDKLSYRVVLSEAEIVFFLTYLEDKWYITLFDRASFDCSSK
jgi:hypothetical protein